MILYYFLAVQDSSIGDLVTESVSECVIYLLNDYNYYIYYNYYSYYKEYKDCCDYRDSDLDLALDMERFRE